MNFKEATQPFLWVFYWAGLSFPSSSLNDSKLTHSTFSKKCIFHILNALFLTVSEFILIYIQITGEIAAHHRSVGYFFAIFDTLFFLSVISVSVKYNDQMKNFYLQFRDLDNYINTKTTKRVNYNHFHRQTFRVISSILLPMIVTFIVSKIFPSRLFSKISGILQIPILIYIGIVQSQIIFYVILFNRFIDWLKHWIKSKATNSIGPPFNESNIETIDRSMKVLLVKRRDLNDFTEYRSLKYIHFKLWEISKSFSVVFGWNLLLIIFRNWFSVGFNLYRVFLTVDKLGSNAALARKYN